VFKSDPDAVILVISKVPSSEAVREIELTALLVDVIVPVTSSTLLPALNDNVCALSALILPVVSVGVEPRVADTLSTCTYTESEPSAVIVPRVVLVTAEVTPDTVTVS